MSTSDLYRRLVAAGCQLDSYESDLYALATPEAVRIVEEERGADAARRRFVSRLDGKSWIDLPFAYSPFWDVRANGRRKDDR